MKIIALIISLFVFAVTFTGCGKPESEKVANKYNSLVDKGLSLYHSGDYSKSLACFEKAMILSTDTDKAYLYSALICDEMMDNPHKAKLYYEKFIKTTGDIKKRELAKNWLNNLYGKYCEYKNEDQKKSGTEKFNSEKLVEYKKEIGQLNKLNDNLKHELSLESAVILE